MSESEFWQRSTLRNLPHDSVWKGWIPFDPEQVDFANATLPACVDRKVIEQLRSLVRVWQYQDDVFNLLRTPEDVYRKGIHLRNQFVFYVGHLPAFGRILSIRGLTRWNETKPAPPRQWPVPKHHKFELIFERGIDPDVENPSNVHKHSKKPSDGWPKLDEIVVYRDAVRKELVTGYDLKDILAGKYSEADLCSPNWERLAALAYGGHIAFIHEHEAMHSETLMYMFQQLGSEHKKKFPTSLDWATTPVSAASCQRRWYRFKRDLVTMGVKREEPVPPLVNGRIPAPLHLWGNEFGLKQQEVGPISVSSTVSQGQFLAFVRAGGYNVQRYWGKCWSWRTNQKVSHPPAWKSAPGEGNFFVEMLDGHGLLLTPGIALWDWPVYCSLAEAQAYARWLSEQEGVKYRLPEEIEWNLFANRSSDNIAIGFQHPGPSPVQGGLEAFGNGYELTTTPFFPIDEKDFIPTPDYPVYSSDFFDNKHFTVRGASWVTNTNLLRSSFRNWYQKLYPYAFTKFRLIQDHIPSAL